MAGASGKEERVTLASQNLKSVLYVDLSRRIGPELGRWSEEEEDGALKGGRAGLPAGSQKTREILLDRRNP